MWIRGNKPPFEKWLRHFSGVATVDSKGGSMVQVAVWAVAAFMCDVTSSMSDVTASIHDVQVLCGLLHHLCGLLEAPCGPLQPLCMM